MSYRIQKNYRIRNIQLYRIKIIFLSFQNGSYLAMEEHLFSVLVLGHSYYSVQSCGSYAVIVIYCLTHQDLSIPSVKLSLCFQVVFLFLSL